MEEIRKILDLVDEKMKELSGLEMKDTDDQRLWEKFRLEWNYNSNHIEGSTLTYGDTKLLLIREGNPGGQYDMREIDEMRAHDLAVYKIVEYAKDKDRELTEADIRELNQIILVKPFWKEAITPDGKETRKKITPGQYKEHPNHVLLPNGEIFRYTEPVAVSEEMKELMNWYRNETADTHPAIVAATLHYRLVRIHPFDDGNGRIARLVMNYHLLKSGYPPVIIKSADKKAYLNALNQADTGNLPAFLGYIANALLWSLDLSIDAAKGLPIEEEEDWKKEVEILKKEVANKKEIAKKSKELVFERFKNSFLPLIREMKSEYGRLFDELFFESIFYADIDHRYDFTKIITENDVETLGKKIADSPDVNKFAFSFDWKNYKKEGFDRFNIGLNCLCDFTNEFDYFICSSSRDFKSKMILIEKSWNTDLTKDEINLIINFFGKSLANDLKRKLKQ